jgi:hypothetical protein
LSSINDKLDGAHCQLSSGVEFLVAEAVADMHSEIVEEAVAATKVNVRGPWMLLRTNISALRCDSQQFTVDMGALRLEVQYLDKEVKLLGQQTILDPHFLADLQHAHDFFV